jgi:methylmalonyl-CoA epimerase
MCAKGIHHLGLAVDDLDRAISTYERLFGAELEERATQDEQGVEAASLRVGPSHVELLAALGPDTPVGRFLDRRGPGLHHVAYRVEDIDAALQDARDAGLRLLDEQPRTGIRGTRVAFLHPSATGGVLTEIVQPPEVH